MTVLGLLIAVFIVCVVIWAVRSLLAAFAVGEPLSTVILVFVVLILLVFILGQLGFGPSLRLT